MTTETLPPAVPTPAEPPSPDSGPALDSLWRRYHELDATSVRDKKRWLRQKRFILFPTLATIVLLPVSKVLVPLVWKDSKETSDGIIQIFTWMSGAAAALLAFINQISGPEPSQLWIRARGAAETLKGEIFRFVGGAAPYDKHRDAQMLLDRTRRLLSSVNSLVAEEVSPSECMQDRPSCPATRSQFLDERVEDQIRFFQKKARESERDARWVKRWTWFLGGLVVVAGVSAPLVGRLDGWILVITTLSATLATQLYLGRNEFQAELYQGAVTNLEHLKNSWLVSGGNGESLQSKYVGLFEDEIARVNGAWLMEWTRKPDTKPEQQ